MLEIPLDSDFLLENDSKILHHCQLEFERKIKYYLQIKQSENQIELNYLSGFRDPQFATGTLIR